MKTAAKIEADRLAWIAHCRKDAREKGLPDPFPEPPPAPKVLVPEPQFFGVIPTPAPVEPPPPKTIEIATAQVKRELTQSGARGRKGKK